jgi:hypothetical protein
VHGKRLERKRNKFAKGRTEHHKKAQIGKK